MKSYLCRFKAPTATSLVVLYKCQLYYYDSFQQPIDIMLGLTDEQVSEMVKDLGFTGDKASQVRPVK